MHKLDERGSLLIPLIIVIVLLLGSIGFGGWAFMSRQDYKDNVQQKIDEAVVAAEEDLTIKKDAEFAEQYKLPNAVYVGPSAYGTITLSYPKTWSNYVDENGRSNTPLNGFMHPKFVPASSDVNYALRYQVVERTYEEELRTFESRTKNGKVKVTAYRLPELKAVLGSKIEGEVIPRKQGLLILLPLRDKTIKVWTEGTEFRKDFDNILKQMKFTP